MLNLINLDPFIFLHGIVHLKNKGARNLAHADTKYQKHVRTDLFISSHFMGIFYLCEAFLSCDIHLYCTL